MIIYLKKGNLLTLSKQTPIISTEAYEGNFEIFIENTRYYTECFDDFSFIKSLAG